MRHFLFVLLSMFLVSPVFAQNAAESYIEVRGQAEKTVTPDNITLSITIREGDYRNLSLSELEKEMKTVLRREGVDVGRDLKVTDMSNNFLRRRARTQDVLQTRSYTLHLGDAALAGRVMDALDGAGIANTRILKMEYGAIDSLKVAVRAEAVASAARTARAMVGALGQELGKAFYIVENGGWSEDRPRMMLAANAVSDSAEESFPELSFEDIKVSAKVTVRFRLE